jgi:hypothetical protein
MVRKGSLLRVRAEHFLKNFQKGNVEKNKNVDFVRCHRGINYRKCFTLHSPLPFPGFYQEIGHYYSFKLLPTYLYLTRGDVHNMFYVIS